MSLLRAIVYVLFVYSGLIKWLPVFPIDPTLIFGFLSVLIILIDSDKFKRVRNTYVGLILILSISFFLFCFISVIYSPSGEFWKQKVLSVILTMLTFVYPFLCFKRQSDFDAINVVFKWVTLFAALLISLLFVTGNLEVITGSRIVGDGATFPDYLVIGEFLGVGILFYLFKLNSYNLLSLLFILFMLILLGARGPFLFVVLTGLMFFSLKTKQQLFNYRSLIILGVLFVTFIFLAQFWEGAKLLSTRLSVFSDISEDNSAMERIVAFNFAIKAFLENPLFGLGLGGFGIYAYGVDENIYPHNIFLEIAAELGMIGITLFASAIVCIFLLAKKMVNNKYVQLYFIVFLFVFFNYLKSGGIIDARKLFVFMGIFTAYINNMITNNYKSINEN